MFRRPLDLLAFALCLASLSLTGCPQETAGTRVRPDNASCVAFERPTSGFSLALEPMFEGVAIGDPVSLQPDPAEPGDWLSLDILRGLRRLSNGPGSWVQSSLLPADALIGDHSISVQSSWLLNFALAPDYPDDPSLYIYYLAADSSGGIYPCGKILVLSRLHFDGSSVDPSSEEVLLTATSPWPTEQCPSTGLADHYGGILEFDADGYLLLSIGDGDLTPHTPARHELNAADDMDSFIGKVLRIDVSGTDDVRGLPYRIPPENPFAANLDCESGVCPEILASGFRNPWRGAIDLVTGELWLGDVGWSDQEEIDIIDLETPIGADYGWPTYEGSVCNPFAPDCATSPNETTGPIWQIPHSLGQSVTGGFVYRGSALPDLQGAFLYADWVTGQLWALFMEAEGAPDARLLLDTGLPIASFARDEAGEPLLLAITLSNPGSVYKIVPGETGPELKAPALLSQTGCFEPDDPSEPVEGLIAYDVQVPLWTDAADKLRWLGLPDDTTIDVDLAHGRLEFPTSTVLIKRFSLDDRHLETRLLMRHEDGAWAGYTYRWDEPLGDGVLLEGGLTESLGAGSPVAMWTYPSSGECLRCHTAASGRVLGPRLGQLTSAADWHEMGLFNSSVRASELKAFPEWSRLGNTSASTEARARNYMDSNCAHCHQPGGPTPIDLDLRRTTPLSLTNACDVPPNNDLGLADAMRIAPGRPEASVLLSRTERRDSLQMPPLGTHVADLEATVLLREWIAGLADCGAAR